MAVLKWSAGIIAALLAVLLIGGAALLLVKVPATQAYICPSCVGLQKVADRVYTDSTASAEQKAHVLGLIAASKRRVAAFYGSFDKIPTLFVCFTPACDARLGGDGAKARAYGPLDFIHVSPDGINETILTHELSHTEFYARIGGHVGKTATAAWFDEGLAVIVSDDRRYLKAGPLSAEKCLSTSKSDLPIHMSDWPKRAAANNDLYAHAACAVLEWMDANGGRAGLLSRLSEVAAGKSALP